jgi:hypothetical protein
VPRLRILIHVDVHSSDLDWLEGILIHLEEVGGMAGLDGIVLPIASGGLSVELPLAILSNLSLQLPLIIAPSMPDIIGLVPIPYQGIFFNGALSTQIDLIKPVFEQAQDIYLTANLLRRAALPDLASITALVVEGATSRGDVERRLRILYTLRDSGLPLGYQVETGDEIQSRHAIGYGATTLVLRLTPPASGAILERGQRLETARHLRDEVTRLRSFAASSIDPLWSMTPDELDRYDNMRLSLVAARDLKKGEPLTADRVRTARSRGGISPDLLPQLIGLLLAYDLAEDKPITFGMLDQPPSES